MKMINKAVRMACPLVFLLSLLAGCHTVHGVGQDMSSAGYAISDAAAAADDRS